MNKKGSLWIAGWFAFFFFIIGVLIFPLLQDIITDARTNLSCASFAGLSDGNILACLMTSASIPYFAIILLTFIGGIIGNEL